MKIFKIIAGVILIIAGAFCFAHPGESFISIAFLLGCAMVASGICGLITFFLISRKGDILNYIMAESLLSIILGCLVLSDRLLADAAIPVFFGMWVLISGVIRVMEAYVQRRPGWMTPVLLLSLGVLGIAAGLYAFFNTDFFAFSVILLTGILFVAQGIIVVLVGANLSVRRRERRS